MSSVFNENKTPRKCVFLTKNSWSLASPPSSFFEAASFCLLYFILRFFIFVWPNIWNYLKPKPNVYKKVNCLSCSCWQSHTDEDEGASNIRVQHPSLTGNIVSLGMNMHKGIRGHLVQSVTPGGLAHKAHIKWVVSFKLWGYRHFFCW